MRQYPLYGRVNTEFEQILDLEAPVSTGATIIFRARARLSGTNAVDILMTPVLENLSDTTTRSWRVIVPPATMAALDPTESYFYRVVASDGSEQVAGPFYVYPEWP